jgi:hypothetical protein
MFSISNAMRHSFVPVVIKKIEVVPAHRFHRLYAARTAGRRESRLSRDTCKWHNTREHYKTADPYKPAHEPIWSDYLPRPMSM